jgi:CheY-like chemotaxis protein
MSNETLNDKKPFQFLIIEDNEYNRLVLIDTLQEWKSELQIEVAENGKIGFEKASVKAYDLIFMDLQMPVMNGHESCVNIKKLPKPYCDIPILAVTANALKIEEEQCLAEGMIGFITKPFDEKVLIDTIKKTLNINDSVNLQRAIKTE